MGKQETKLSAADLQKKTKINDRLTEAVKAAPKSEKKRSPDLTPLTHEYEAMKKRLRSLVAATKNYHEALKQLDKTRMEMVSEMSSFSERSPIYDTVGSRNEKSLVYANQLVSKQAQADNDLLQKSVVDYAIEWEKIVATRIDDELKKTKKLQEAFDHYKKKVDGLRQKVNDAEAKGKPLADSVMEKHKRNEAKLDEAWKEYEQSAAQVCILIEEVTEHAWKDLFPLVKATMKWQSDCASNEAEIYATLPDTMDKMSVAFAKKVKTHAAAPETVPKAKARK